MFVTIPFTTFGRNAMPLATGAARCLTLENKVLREIFSCQYTESKKLFDRA